MKPPDRVRSLSRLYPRVLPDIITSISHIFTVLAQPNTVDMNTVPAVHQDADER